MAARAAAESSAATAVTAAAGGGKSEDEVEEEEQDKSSSSSIRISSLLARVLRERAGALAASGEAERARRDQEVARVLEAERERR